MFKQIIFCDIESQILGGWANFTATERVYILYRKQMGNAKAQLDNKRNV